MILIEFEPSSHLTIQAVSSTEAFIDKWQTLIGSALGVFLAIMLPIAGFLVNVIIQKVAYRKESLRRVEVGVTQTLNQLISTVDQLDEFMKRADVLVRHLEENASTSKGVFPETNFPPIIEINFDKGLSKLRFRSYYLHNKILNIEYIVMWINSSLKQFKYDYRRLLERAESWHSKGMPPDQQWLSLSKNLDGYVTMFKSLLKAMETDYQKTMAQTKAYNLTLMKSYYRKLWLYEGASFKYFKDKVELFNYKSSPDTLERIDKLMEEKTDKIMQQVHEAKEEKKLTESTQEIQ